MDSLLWTPKNCLLIFLSVCRDLHLQDFVDRELWFRGQNSDDISEGWREREGDGETERERERTSSYLINLESCS